MKAVELLKFIASRDRYLAFIAIVISAFFSSFEFVAKSPTPFSTPSPVIYFSVGLGFFVLIVSVTLLATRQDFSVERGQRTYHVSIQTRIVLLLGVLIWILSSALTTYRGGEMTALALVTPAVLLLLAARPPTRNGVFLAFGAWMTALLCMVWIFWIGEAAGFLDGAVGSERNFVDIFGLYIPEYRWSGPFGSFASAGFAGVLLASYGITKPTLGGFFYLVSGLHVVVMAESRVAMACLLGAGLAAVTAYVRRRHGENRWIRWIVSLFNPIFALLGAFVVFVSGANGRTEIWIAYLESILVSPAFGLGALEILSPTGPGIAAHGHNFLLDTAVRYGLISAVLSLCAASILFSEIFQHRHVLSKVAIPLTFIVFLGNTMETMVDTMYLRLDSMGLILLIFLADPLSHDRTLDRGRNG